MSLLTSCAMGVHSCHGAQPNQRALALALTACLPRPSRVCSTPTFGCNRQSHQASLGRRAFSSCSRLSTLPPTIHQLLTATLNVTPASGSVQDASFEGEKVEVRGWARSVRRQKHVTFIGLDDGSRAARSGGAGALQAVIRADVLKQTQTDASPTPGAALSLRGTLRRSRARLQNNAQPEMELEVEDVRVVAGCEAATYPFQARHRLEPESLRRIAHLRPRTSRHAATLRTRDVVERALAAWYAENDFIRVTTPLITGSDCEGAGEVFRVAADADVQNIAASTTDTSAGDAQIQASGSDTAAASQPSSTSTTNVASDALDGFFGRPAYLTVSSQLHLEALALGVGRVWTLAPAFRAEGSATNRHLAEFWMLEAELAFVESLGSVMDCVEASIKAAIHGALGSPGFGLKRSSEATDRQTAAELRAADDTRFLAQAAATSNSSVSAGDSDNASAEEREAATQAHLDTLRDASSIKPWARMSYTEAIRALQSHHTALPNYFTFEPVWGEALASEHERWLAGAYVQGPVFVTDYPAHLKPFYMRTNDQESATTTATAESTAGAHGETVACFDLLVPRIGELVGGSLREERADLLNARIASLELDKDKSGATTGAGLEWYTQDLRKYGGAPHGGYGLGMERLISWITGVENLRDCTNFPRVKGSLRY